MHPLSVLYVQILSDFQKKSSHMSSHARNTNIEACKLIDFSTILRSICVNVWNVLVTHNYGDTLRSFVFSFLFMFFSYSLCVANKSVKESLKQCKKKMNAYKVKSKKEIDAKQRVQANTNSLKSDDKLHTWDWCNMKCADWMYRFGMK